MEVGSVKGGAVEVVARLKDVGSGRDVGGLWPCSGDD